MEGGSHVEAEVAADHLLPTNSPERPDSGLRAIAAVARHHKLDWSLQRLAHLYSKDREPDAQELARIARAEGLKATVQKVNWNQLARFQKLTPFLVRLETGAWFVALNIITGHDANTEDA